jgi:putative heme degradation protein
MDIAIKPTKAVRIRHLKEEHPYLTEGDIAAMTGYPAGEVAAALRRRSKDKPKSRIGQHVEQS